MHNDQPSKKKNTVTQIAELIADAVEECGCTLWDVSLNKEGQSLNLLVTIDKDGGVSLVDCEMVNDAIGPILDREDPIEGSYTLEVSSPGLERELKTDAHLAAFCGKEVSVKLYAPKDGKKILTGILEKYDAAAGQLTLRQEDGSEAMLARRDCAQIHAVFRF